MRPIAVCGGLYRFLITTRTGKKCYFHPERLASGQNLPLGSLQARPADFLGERVVRESGLRHSAQVEGG